MITQKRAAPWRLDRTALPVLATACLLLASTLPLAAQHDRSRPTDSGDVGRHAEPSSPPSYDPPSSSYTPPPSSSGGDDRGGSSNSSNDSGDEGRHAVPRSGDDDRPDRQPSHNRGGRGHSGNYWHGGYYGGHYYGPGYYWGPSWWWYFWGPYDWWYPGYSARDYRASGEAGALDLDVSPAKTEVYIDGQYIGRVDSYDGWPQYLWLPKGTYDVVLFREGYQTIARQITIYPGVVMSVDDRMEPGESKRPEDLVTKTHDRRDERIRFERERSERIDRGERGDDDYDDWRDRRERWRDREDRDEDDDAEESDRRGDEAATGRVRLDIEPEDASVYLDGKFVGTGTDLARLRAGLVLEPGKHRLAVVRPGHRSQEMDFDVKAGEDLDLEVELEESDSGR
ncbi:MAG TPA: PEGA domain-containing protein [Thermoanaerobaculia bacterium]